MTVVALACTMADKCYLCGFKGPSPYCNVIKEEDGHMCSVCWIRRGYAHEPETRLGSYESEDLSENECAFYDSVELTSDENDEKESDNRKVAKEAAEEHGCESDEELVDALEEILDDGYSLSGFAERADTEGPFYFFTSYTSDYSHWTFDLAKRVLSVCRRQ